MNLASDGASPFQWNQDAVRRLAEDAAWALTSNPSGTAEVAGLLLGKSGSSVEIVHCHPVCLMREQDHAYALTGPGRREFERAIASFQSIPEGEFSVVGFYRSDLDGKLTLTEEDLGLIRTCFRDTNQVTLLLNVTRDQSCSAKLFSGANGQILFDFGSSDHAKRLPTWHDLWQNLSGADPMETSASEGAPAPAEPVAPAEPAPLAHPRFCETGEVQEYPLASQRRSVRIPWFLLAAAALLAAFLGYPILKQSAKRSQETGSSGPPVPVRSDSSVRSGLALRVEKYGDDLQLDWNRATPIIAAASGGILTIREGHEREKQAMLDANLLKNGSVVYRPVGNEVFLRLVIFKPGGATLGESETTYPVPKAEAVDDPLQRH